MTKEKYETLGVIVLRQLARARGVRNSSAMKKARLIEAMVELDEQERAVEVAKAAGMPIPVFQNSPAPEKTKEEKSPAAEPAAPARVRRRAKTADKKEAGEETQEGKGRRKGELNVSVSKRRGEGRRRKAVPAEEVPEENRKKEPGAESAETEENRKAEPADSVPAAEKLPLSAEGQAGKEEGGALKEAEKAEKASAEASDLTASEGNKAEETEEKGAGGEREMPAGNPAHATIPTRHASGILEIMPDGYGFLRNANYMPGDEDVYVSPSQIRRFALRTGDYVTGYKRERGIGEKYGGLLYVGFVNGKRADEARKRYSFDRMTPIFPDERIRLERKDGSRAVRIVDLISPIGKGQRGMIVSPPKAGKTTLLKEIAKSILFYNPKSYLIVLLIDERPEEVTDIREFISGENAEVVYSTFDETPEHHKKVAELVIERARRLVEMQEDVIILLDSITRLARAYNVLVPPSGRTLSGGLDPTALYMPKRFFGAARNMREGGSLTILATALIDTGSKMDDVIYEEFKGTGNMELILDRKLQEKRIFPAIDIVRSGTRREDLLLGADEKEAVERIRRQINGVKAEEAVEALLNAFAKYPTNQEVVNSVLDKWN
ncbi:MAG: transcription termination factor Rho [Lachnospiraceae bacterium]|nr:transcription termination factor Rho [Lachnospiraceae bacterium]